MVNLETFLSFNFWSLFTRTSRSSRAVNLKQVDYSDIAFQIATTENLDNLFPLLLSQNALQTNCSTQLKHYDSLFILTPTSAEKYRVHSSANTTPNPQLLNYFESILVKKRGFNNSQKAEKVGVYNFILFPIQNSDSVSPAFLVIVFKGEAPKNNEAANVLRPLKNALQKGLLAHNNKLKMIANAVHFERKAQAADLHDSIAQILSYLKLRTSSLNKLCKESDPAIYQLASDIENQVSFAHRLTRELISSSRLTYKEPNLSKAFENALDEFEQHSEIVFEMDNRCKEALEDVSHPTETLFIVREALCNLVRHSHASHARIVITQTPDKHIIIVVEDNGIGIHSGTKRNDSFGLRIMEDRAHKMRAQLSVNSRKKGGTQIKLQIPRTKNNHA